MALRELDSDSFGFNQTVLVRLFNFDQDGVIYESVLTNGASVGMETTAETD